MLAQSHARKPAPPLAARGMWLRLHGGADAFGSALGDAVVGAITKGDGQKTATQWWQEPDQSKPLTQADIAGFLEGADDARYSQGGRDWDAYVKANRLSPEALAKKNWDESVELMNAEQKMRDALDRQGDLEEQHKNADAYARQLKREAARKAAAQSSPNDPATRDGSITVGGLAALNAAFDRRDAAVAARNKFVGPLPSYGGLGEMKATPYDWKTDSVVGKMTAGVFGDLYGATIGKLTRDDNLAVNPFTGRILSGREEFDAQLGGVLLLAPGPKGVSGLKGLAGDVANSEVGMFRRTANQGAFGDLPVTMNLKTVRGYAEDAGVGLEGIKVRIIRDESLVGKGVTGYAHPTGKTLDLYPDAFRSPEELVRTLGHERTHLYQAKTFGPPQGTPDLLLNEKAAYGLEDSFVKYWRSNGGQ